MDVVEHLRFLMGEIVNAYLTSNGLDVGEIADQREAFYLIVTDSQFPYFDVNIGRLGEECYISLIVAVVFEEIDLFISHFHFTVIEVYTGFIYDDQTVLHEVFTYIVFGDLESTTNSIEHFRCPRVWSVENRSRQRRRVDVRFFRII